MSLGGKAYGNVTTAIQAAKIRVNKYTSVSVGTRRKGQERKVDEEDTETREATTACAVVSDRRGVRRRRPAGPISRIPDSRLPFRLA